jgi:hypothetical protein
VNASVEELTKAVDESFEALKALTLEKRVLKKLCRPVFANRDTLAKRDLELEEKTCKALSEMAAQVQKPGEMIRSLIAEETGRLEAEWNRAKQDVVPGDELLDRVLQKFGRRYRKDRDAAVLASLFVADAVTGELSDLLRTIGSV